MHQLQPIRQAGKILVAGREPGVTDRIAEGLLEDGHLVRTAGHVAGVALQLETERFDLIVLHAALPPSQIQQILDAARRHRPSPVIFLVSTDRDLLDNLRTLRSSARSIAGDRTAELPGREPEDAAPMTLDEMERSHILRVLRHCRGNKKRTAELLGINRSSLYGKLKRFGMMPSTGVAGVAGALLVATAILPLIAAPAFAAADPHRKIAPAVLDRVSGLMDAGDPDAIVHLIVRTWTAPGDEELAAVTMAGGSPGRVFGSIHALSVEVAARDVTRLARSTRVRRLSLDHGVIPSLSPAAISSSAARSAMEAGFRGDGIGVAVLDSGVSPTIDVEAVAEVDIVEPDGLSADYFGHGTHAAGIIAGSGEASLCRSCYRSFRGIAPGARIYSVKVLDGSGKGRVSDVIAGIDWVLRHHEAEGIRVMNISLGHPVDEPYTTDPLCSAVEEAWKAGIVVIVSAGNQGGDGNATITSPGNHPSVITVGAAEDWGSIETSDDIVASFSSLGPTRIDGVLKPDILAPGTGVVSLRSPGSLLDEALPGQVLRLSEYMTDPTFGDGESPYIAMSGTSTAAPAVAAAAALLLSQDRDATPDDIKARLLVSARKMNDSIVARGAGLLDVASALELGAAGLSAVSAPSPRLRIVIDAQGAEAVAFEEIGSAWGDPEAWPSELIWGGQETWGLGESWMAAEAWSAAGQTGVVPFPAEGAFAVWGFR